MCNLKHRFFHIFYMFRLCTSSKLQHPPERVQTFKFVPFSMHFVLVVFEGIGRPIWLRLHVPFCHVKKQNVSKCFGQLHCIVFSHPTLPHQTPLASRQRRARNNKYRWWIRSRIEEASHLTPILFQNPKKLSSPKHCITFRAFSRVRPICIAMCSQL